MDTHEGREIGVTEEEDEEVEDDNDDCDEDKDEEKENVEACAEVAMCVLFNDNDVDDGTSILATTTI
jgi:hypothetical protein